MKKAVVASLLAVASVASCARIAVAQTPADTGSNAQSGVQLAPAEYNAYTAAIGQSTPQTQAPALESFLQTYPQSKVKEDVLQRLMLAYSSFDPAKTLDAADRLLQVDPNNIRALTFESYFRLQNAEKLTDATAKQAELDKAAESGQKGLDAPKPASLGDADFAKLKEAAAPVFHRAIATAALNKKDSATAVTQLKQSLSSVPVDQTKTPGPLLQDTYTLAQAYYQSTPPDLLNCTWYAARAASFAPEPYKSQMMPLAKYCYKKYHGADDGFDAVATASQQSLEPPADFASTVKPAPKPEDIVKQVIASTPDLATLAVSDKEFILQNGSADDAAKVWDTIKGKSVQFPDTTVVSVSDTALQVAVSDDAVQSKTADFTFNLTAPLKTPPAVGDKVTVTGTYDSFTPKPLMITMSNGAVVEPKKAPAKPTPAHRAPRRR
ncbi:outer membrane protein assembly factor BamD [Edaphobacter albus]|uniref:hypothetical protein n=1 Tax=Edaphobacter sp. 4G125 TaxID=2763071 RepID=UPI001646E943|nr:hypothetical protein [Edaphobacter sp. 4G125]QNI35736.1 hypothetical protein H7846_11875 [Edaphobacter sp. 4G125]